MSIRIHNSLSGNKEEFHPLKPKEIKMYACGPTVYDEPHIGHARSAYIFDVIRKYLTYKGYKVKFVRNVTDVDDKIINKAKEEFPGEDLNSSFKKVADKYLTSYHQALKSLGIGEDGIIEPKASEYIPKMLIFIQGLIERGAAYVSGGDVYFDITKAKNYGKLSNQSLEKMESGVRLAPNENKRNALDFALWKSAKENEPSWDSPWGKGRPGWHIECSVMSSDILGEEFDIHGGGIDLIFPHHENEVAQSEAAGEKFARYWIHHGLLTINGQKMSKSLGNFVTVQDFLNKHGDNAEDYLKLLFLNTHYKHPVDYTDEKIEEMKKERERFRILFRKLKEIYSTRDLLKIPAVGMKEINRFTKEFEAAMDDDFNTPQALAVLFDLVTYTNKLIHGKDTFTDKEIGHLAQITNLLEHLSEDVFGLEFSSEGERSIKGLSFEEVERIIEERTLDKKRKDFASADQKRKVLEEKGIILEDTKDGKTTWRRKI